MIKDFQKIDIDMNGINLFDTNSEIVLHNPRNLDFTYYKIKEEYVDTLTERLPVEYRSKLYMIVYVIIGGPNTFYPHSDKVGFSAINYYFVAGSGETSFYELKNPDFKWATINQVEHEGWYDYNDLDKVSTFSPSNNECYILNTSAIHDVKMFTEEKRHFIQYIFNEQL